MIANVDIRLSFFEIFSSIEAISDESEFAKDPAPDVKEKITYNTCARAEEKWKNQSWQENDHKHAENNSDPRDIKEAKNWLNEFHNSNYSITFGTRK